MPDKVLIVDDEPNIVISLEFLMQQAGYEIAVARDGQQALDALDSMLPAAQRMAELLDAQLLDEEQNALGRQRILSLRDEMRQYDRQHRDWPASTR